MLTGHQGTRETLDKINLKGSDASQEIRILANLDVLIGINQTEFEMNNNTARLNVLSHRHAKFNPARQVKVTQQFSAGQFAIDGMVIDRPNPKDFKQGIKGATP